jgi:hypothetical protein
LLFANSTLIIRQNRDRSRQTDSREGKGMNRQSPHTTNPTENAITNHMSGITTYPRVIITRHNTPIHNILSTAPQLSISQKAPGTLPEYGNVMPKHVGATIHN